jgi:hypothetical protein
MSVSTNRIFAWVREHTKLVAGLSAGVVVGAAGSAVVMASIPDSSGVIHACYSTGLLAKVKIIDSATQTCGANETAIAWNQTGPAGPQGSQGPAGPTGPQGPAGNSENIAYGYIAYDTDTDTTSIVNGLGVTGIQRRQDIDAGGTKYGFCVTVPFLPKNVQVTQFGNNQPLQGDARNSDGSWLVRGAGGTDPCADVIGANVWVGGAGKFFLVH